MLKRIISNHVLANIAFALIIILGILAFETMSRARDPELTFNYVNILTALGGASPLEVERRVTDPIEERISSTIKDINFIESSSREGISSIDLRFDDISDEDFREHLSKLQTEVLNVATDQLPDNATNPRVISISSASFPAAMVVVKTDNFDENFRAYLAKSQKRLERLPGVDSANLIGTTDPELIIAFYPERLVGLGISPPDLADTMVGYFRDASIGDIETKQGKLTMRLEGTSSDPEEIRYFPVVTAQGIVELGEIADIYFGSGETRHKVVHKGKDSGFFSVNRQVGGNELEILEHLNDFIAAENARVENDYEWVVVDDQTITTRQAISLMQSNALIGLTLVVAVSYLFLGGRISLLTTIGIPFTLCGTFIILDAMGRTVNNTALLGVIVALGMIVDDAVVVVEAIHYRLQRGVKALEASVQALQEVAAPVLTSILTTISVFLPLVFLPGVLGTFLAELPVVVCIALAISLVEAFWILPAHVSFLDVGISKESKMQRFRKRMTRGARHWYTRLLLLTFRKPLAALSIALLPPIIAISLLAGGQVKVDFFPQDPYRVYYINVALSPEATLDESILAAQDLEQLALTVMEPDELKESVAYAGLQIRSANTEFGDNLGQVYLTFNLRERGMRSTRELLDTIRETVEENYTRGEISFDEVREGPPVGPAISFNFMGDDYGVLNDAVGEVKAFLADIPAIFNVTDGYSPGAPTMLIKLNGEAIKRSSLTPVVVRRALQSFVDGELIGQFQRFGEEIDIRLVAVSDYQQPEDLLLQTVSNQLGEEVALGELLDIEYVSSARNAKHYNYSRSISIEADIDPENIDLVSANQQIFDFWESIQSEYPGVRIDNTGQFDDLLETLNAIVFFFILGMGLIYLILGTQFGSYLQPGIVLLSVPLAFSGVVFGVIVTGNSMSFYSMYGVVALAGIAVNSAIVLVSAANQRIEAGMGVLHATVFAARRRFIPVIITTFTTIGGLFSLAAGLAGASVIWGPLAVAIVSGLFFSTPLILLVIPQVYRLLMTSRFNHI